MVRELFGPRSAVGLALLLAAALFASVAWPLATYTLTLGLFGVAHVLAELRYVDERFGRGLGRSLRTALLLALAGIVVARLVGISRMVDSSTAVAIELGLGLALVALVLPTLARTGRRALAVALPVAIAIAIAIVHSPVAALLVLAVLHNFTPWGFLLEAAEPAERKLVRRLGVVVFIALPLTILAGWIWAWVSPLHLGSPEWTPLGYGPLSKAMRAYVPASLEDKTLAYHAFAACVFLQCVHYITVLGLLPRLTRGRGGTVPWPSRAVWIGGLLATSLLVVTFAIDFPEARRGYGVIAAVHAWLELPILLLALGGFRSPPSPPSTRTLDGQSTSK